MDKVSSNRCDQIMSYLVNKLGSYILQWKISDEFCARYPQAPLPGENVSLYKYDRIANWYMKLLELDKTNCYDSEYYQEIIYIYSYVRPYTCTNIPSKKRKTYEEDESNEHVNDCDQEKVYDGFITKWYKF
jgi:hypothetical protein